MSKAKNGGGCKTKQKCSGEGETIVGGGVESVSKVLHEPIRAASQCLTARAISQMLLTGLFLRACNVQLLCLGMSLRAMIQVLVRDAASLQSSITRLFD